MTRLPNSTELSTAQWGEQSPFKQSANSTEELLWKRLKLRDEKTENTQSDLMPGCREASIK
jgi:hypothetical protein